MDVGKRHFRLAASAAIGMGMMVLAAGTTAGARIDVTRGQAWTSPAKTYEFQIVDPKEDAGDDDRRFRQGTGLPPGVVDGTLAEPLTELPNPAMTVYDVVPMGGGPGPADGCRARTHDAKDRHR